MLRNPSDPHPGRSLSVILGSTLLLAVAPVLTGCGSSSSPPPPQDTGPAKARSNVDAADEPDPDAEPELTALEILELAEAKTASIEDYHCTSHVYIRSGDEEDTKILNVYYKRPGLFRNEVIEGDNQGGMVTRNADQVIHGKRGGALGLIVLTLEEDDERIRSIRGRRFFEASWDDEVADIRKASEAGYELVRLEDQSFDDTDCLIVAAVTDSDEHAVTQYELWIDADTHLIRRRRDYEGDSLVKDTRFMEPELDTGLDDALFSLK